MVYLDRKPLIFFCFLLMASSQILLQNVHANDDNLYFILNSVRVLSPLFVEALYAELFEILNFNNEPFFEANRGILRFEMHKDHAANYWLVSWLQSFFFWKLDSLKFNTDLAGLYLSAITFSSLFFSLLTICLMAFSFRSARKIETRFIISLILLILLELLIRLYTPGADEHLMYTHSRHWALVFGESILNSIQMLFLGTPGTSLIGYTPRNFFTLLFLAVIILRHLKNYRLSYFLLAGMCFVHGSYALLILGVMIATDLIVRPHIFEKLPDKFCITTLVVVCLGRETLFIDDFLLGAIPSHGVRIALLFILVFVGFAACSFLSRIFFVSVQGPISLNVGKQEIVLYPGTAYDFLIVFMLFCVTFFPALIVSQSSDDYYSVHYFWSQVHGRFIGIYRACFLIFGLYYLVAFIEKIWTVSEKKVLSGGVLASILFITAFGASDKFLENKTQFNREIVSIENMLRSAKYCPISQNEHIVYFAFLKAYSLQKPLSSVAKWSICKRSQQHRTTQAVDLLSV